MNLKLWRLAALSLFGVAGAMLAGCDDTYLPQGSGRSEQPISSAALEQMTKIDTTPSSPVLIRTYKKEAELEIWKMNSQGQYALLKTYPMCRWSGQLGPKKREGDLQVPEGFYTITPGQLNPNSHYYLAFNVGYPNAYDKAYGRDGGNVMVHGVCSSAGCFSMTDEQVADIYAIARDAFRGGQREIQLQSYPFRMTPENLAKYRLDPNIAFWKEIKKGSDYFEVTKTEPNVLVCDKHYVFGAVAQGPVSNVGACPKLERDEEVASEIAEKDSKDEIKAEQLASSGVKAIRTVYADGGQNPVFKGYKDTSDPEALEYPPQEIVLQDRAPLRPVWPQRKWTPSGSTRRSWRESMARTPLRRRQSPRRRRRARALPRSGLPPMRGRLPRRTPRRLETASIPATAPAQNSVAEASVQPVAMVTPAQTSGAEGGVWGASTSSVKKWLNWGDKASAQPSATAMAPRQDLTAPLPPDRTSPQAQGAANHKEKERLRASQDGPERQGHDRREAERASGAVTPRPKGSRRFCVSPRRGTVASPHLAGPLWAPLPERPFLAIDR